MVRERLVAREFKPIDDAAKDGNARIVKNGSKFARAYWRGDGPADPAGMWAYHLGVGYEPSNEQVDFEPNEYAELGV